MHAVYEWLDKHLFPKVISYTTHHLHIVGLMLLWLLLLLGGAFSAFELVGGNYTNGLSALAGCIIMLQQTKHHTHVKGELEKLHKKMDDMKPKPRARKSGANA